ncbi:unnamed protein product [Dibothriocephalus latus]|uniref:B box-type domain-containing protein n=1 Tax=Dibothriocephalus latus TaxID=60516 RepID=A0A3P6THF0_DIBLA|nr:unnamed protein product [Dibothriocephalus latus]
MAAKRSNGGGTPGDTFENLSEVFKCFICMEKLNNTRLCPHCSKLCCYDCITVCALKHFMLLEMDNRKSTTMSSLSVLRNIVDAFACKGPIINFPSVPSALLAGRFSTKVSPSLENDDHVGLKTTLHTYELVNCRWADEVTQQLDNLQGQSLLINKSSGSRPHSSAMNSDICEPHRERLSVFCQTCDRAICHECALFESRHSQHTFRPLDDVYKEHIDRLQVEMDKLKLRHLEMRSLIQDVEVELLDSLLQEVQTQLNSASKANLIFRSMALSTMFAEVHKTPMASLVSAPVPAEFQSEIVPAYDSSTFVMRNFTLLRQRVDPVYSPPLHVGGLSWRLKVYPDGNGVVRGNYLSVFLELSAGIREPSKFVQQHTFCLTRAVADQTSAINVLSL